MIKASRTSVFKLILGAVMNSDLIFEKYINTVWYHLKNISRIKGLMSQQDISRTHSMHLCLAALYPCLYSSQSDNCSWFRTILTNTKKVVHITQLWGLLTGSLSVIIYPSYIGDLLTQCEPASPLMSSGTGFLSVPTVRTVLNCVKLCSMYAERTPRKLQINTKYLPNLYRG